nr:unnamed protein product [Callosobruchus analis]
MVTLSLICKRGIVYAPGWMLERRKNGCISIFGAYGRRVFQEEFLDFKADSTVKDDFLLLTLEQYWLKRQNQSMCS